MFKIELEILQKSLKEQNMNLEGKYLIFFIKRILGVCQKD